MDFEHLKFGPLVSNTSPQTGIFRRKFPLEWNFFKEQVCWGGTQKLYGFFAGFRKEVGKRALNTAGSLMHCQVRLYQFKYWFGGLNLFSIFGKIREVERTSSKSLTWDSLEAFKAVRRQENVAEEENVLEKDAVSLASGSEFSYLLEGD